MKIKILSLTVMLVAVVTWVEIMAQPQKPSPLIQWMNDSFYYRTNTVWDSERNKTNDTSFGYTKTVITTNKVGPIYLPMGSGLVEIGAREDGVIVWRKRE